jgi:hypothetical protein
MTTVDREKFPFQAGPDPISRIKVMQSAAGYYVGRSYWDVKYGFEGPFSRESGYYLTEAAAEEALENYED